MNWIKLIISIFAIALLESAATEDLRAHTVVGRLFEIGLCILFGAWIVSNGW